MDETVNMVQENPIEKCAKILSAICSLIFFKTCRDGEMVDAHASGVCGAIHGGSSPLLGTGFIAYNSAVEARVAKW